MKLNLPFFKSKTPEPTGMMTQAEVTQIHQMLVAIVTGQTPIRFNKLKAGEVNPIQMVAEVFACVLRHPNGRQVTKVIEQFQAQLKEFYDKQAEQEKIVKLVQKGYEPPEPSAIVPPNNSHSEGA